MLKFDEIFVENKNNGFLLSNINTEFHPGEITGVLGLENSGKSLMLSLPSGINNYSGKIYFKKDDLKTLKNKSLKKTISHKSDYSINPSDKIIDIVSQSRLIIKKFFNPLKETDRQIIQKYINYFNLNDLKSVKYNNLSDGQKQRVKLAFLFCREAPILILNNPDIGLDINSTSTLYDIIRKYTLSGKYSIIIESSNVNFLLEVTDRIISIKEGQIFCDKNTYLYNESDFRNLFNKNFILTKNVLNGKNIIMPTADI